MNSLKQYYQKNKKMQEKTNLTTLFNKSNLTKQLNLWLIWYSTAFVFYGLNFNFIITLKKLHIEI